VSVDDVADELYALPPEDFTAARDAAAKNADGDDRKAVKALRRPTVSAYVINALVRRRREEVEALVALGDEMRAAMTGKGDVRALTEERRDSISDLIGAAAQTADRELTAAVEQEAAATLEAATADPMLGAAVLSGRLVKPLRYAGFGTTPDLDDALATPLPERSTARRKPTATSAPKAAATPAAKRPGKKAAAKKTTGKPVGKPTSAPTSADAGRTKELTRLRSQVLDLAGQADDAQRRYDQAVRAATEARQLLDAAEKERAEAHKAANAAQRQAEQARRELGRLERS
jgi:hypothetical protein